MKAKVKLMCTACREMVIDVVYDVDGNIYCSDAVQCSEQHPNTTDNIIERGHAIEMFVKDTVDPSENAKKLLKATSVRLSRTQAEYIQEVMDTKDLSKVDAIRYCIELARTASMQPEPQPEPTPEPVIVEFTLDEPEPPQAVEPEPQDEPDELIF